MSVPAMDTPRGRNDKSVHLPAVILLEVFPYQATPSSPKEKVRAKDASSHPTTDVSNAEHSSIEVIPLSRSVAERVPYIVSALSEEWCDVSNEKQDCKSDLHRSATVKVFLPHSCSVDALQVLLS